MVYCSYFHQQLKSATAGAAACAGRVRHIRRGAASAEQQQRTCYAASSAPQRNSPYGAGSPELVMRTRYARRQPDKCRAAMARVLRSAAAW